MKKLMMALLMMVTAIGYAQTEVKLDADAKKKLDTFLSNFSEAYVRSFTADSLTDEILIDFGRRHCRINKYKSLKNSKDGLDMIVPSKMIDAATEKYFGKKVKSHKSKTYAITEHEGEAYTFSQIRSFIDNGNGTFTAKGVNLFGSAGFRGDPHGTPDEWKKAKVEVECFEGFAALLQKSPTDKSRYILLQYQTFARVVGPVEN